MSVNSMNTYSHSHNNNSIKQKTCQIIVSNPIYRCTKKTHVQKKLFIYLSIFA